MNKNNMFVILATLLMMPFVTLAQSDFEPGEKPGNQSIEAGGLKDFFIRIFNIILDIVWIVFVGVAIIMFVYAGFMYMTARGDESKIKEANRAVLWGIVGVAVAVLAFSIPFAVRQEVNSLGQ